MLTGTAGWQMAHSRSSLATRAGQRTHCLEQHAAVANEREPKRSESQPRPGPITTKLRGEAPCRFQLIVASQSCSDATATRCLNQMISMNASHDAQARKGSCSGCRRKHADAEELNAKHRIADMEFDRDKGDQERDAEGDGAEHQGITPAYWRGIVWLDAGGDAEQENRQPGGNVRLPSQSMRRRAQ